MLRRGIAVLFVAAVQTAAAHNPATLDAMTAPHNEQIRMSVNTHKAILLPNPTG
jgi:hypothetical protein